MDNPANLLVPLPVPFGSPFTLSQTARRLSQPGQAPAASFAPTQPSQGRLVAGAGLRKFPCVLVRKGRAGDKVLGMALKHTATTTPLSSAGFLSARLLGSFLLPVRSVLQVKTQRHGGAGKRREVGRWAAAELGQNPAGWTWAVGAAGGRDANPSSPRLRASLGGQHACSRTQ